MSSAKVYNIVLLGETGTGKSLLINSFANYFQFDSLQEAINSEERVNLISSKFKVTDANDEEHVIVSGKNDGNERTEIGESFTVSCKSYKFQLGDVSVRLVDTPGVGDTNGEEADRSNVANILNYINNFEDLHAIGIVMNNTQTKMTDRFTYCLKTLLSNLNKSATNNIVFLLTHNTKFKPGPVKDVIDKFMKNELKDSTLKLDKDRVFCFENEGYQHVIAVKRGVVFDEDELDVQKKNWHKSSAEMRRLVKRVSGLTPHRVRDTMSVNDARQFIKVIHPFLLIVLENIDENDKLITKYEHDFRRQTENVKNMESDVNLKKFDVNVVMLDNAVTFCVSKECRQTTEIAGNVKYHYPQQCCVGCGVINSCRWLCEVIDIMGYCKKCGCHGSEHERRYYKTEKISTNLLTDEAAKKMSEATSEREKLEMQIQALEKMKFDLMVEKNVIEDAEKKFEKFLRVHALSKPPEGKFAGSDAAFFNVNQDYEKEIARIECMSVSEFYVVKATLITLPINGGKFKKILEANVKGLTTSVGFKETVKNFLKARF